jgi:hypothetical protein
MFASQQTTNIEHPTLNIQHRSKRPLILTLSPEYRGEGTRRQALRRLPIPALAAVPGGGPIGTCREGKVPAERNSP